MLEMGEPRVWDAMSFDMLCLAEDGAQRVDSDVAWTMRELSPELVDQVMDAVSLLDGDRLRIASCGLVCRQWLPRSRFHVFQYLWLDASRLDSLLTLVETSSSPLLAIVHVVHLDLTVNPLFRLEHLTTLSSTCANLTCIRCTINSPPSEIVPQDFFLETCLPVLGSQCPALTRFELQPTYAETVPLGMITHILASLPALEVFVLLSDSNTIVPTGIVFNSIPARLQSLQLGRTRGICRLFEWLLSLPVLPKLKSLQWLAGPYADADWASLHAYSQRAGVALETLSFCSRTRYDSPDDLEPPPAILGHATKLRVLRLWAESTTRIIPILSSLTSHDLHSIRISLHLQSDHPIPYGEIDRLLARPQFQRLEAFRLEAKNTGLSVLDPPGNEVDTLMPLAYARGIIAFHPEAQEIPFFRKRVVDWSSLFG
ncbi:hypothetical protein FB45DRAFT_1066853 [Roridomyces roridus]|uniref:F-box domain-containing protein n=1 Tax=Roridomyces roridus TaxID=1738132 RepID=A0AAD7FBP0_9AGAR|nr:hypothetical protein FB45DRAFT_1066853 [Roridomyces roridus]